MTKKVLSLLLIMTVAVSCAVAAPVSQSTARRVAETWLQAMGMRDVKTLADVTAETPFTEFYVFAAPASGFVLVSGDDCATPVLGYSVDEHFETQNMPPHVLGFLSGYDEEIRWGKEHKLLVSDTIAQQWKLLANGQMPKAAFDNSVPPLMTTCWDQAPYYNEHCPLDSNGNHFVTGCGATTTAQVMKYWDYPATGYGSHTYNHYGENGFFSAGEQSADFGATTYDWAHMPYRLTALSSPEEVEAVATLMYHVGVGADMWYDYIGSGTFGDNLQSTLVKYFKYAPDATGILRQNYSDSEYCAILRAELDQGRPLITGGELSDYGGHIYNCDGYTTRNYFHFNLGWGGRNSGYYALSGLIGLGSMSLTNNSAIIGIHPNYDWDTAGSTTIITSVAGGLAIVTGAGTYAYGDTATLAVDNVQEGFRFSRWSDGCTDNPRSIYANGGTWHFTAVVDTIPPLIINDTISYCGNNCHIENALGYYNYEMRWGVLFPKEVFPQVDTLTAVQIYTYSSGEYILEVYLDSALDVLAYSDTFHFSNEGWYETQWHTLPLATPVIIDSSQELWITFRSDARYPAAFSQNPTNTPYMSLYGSNLQYYEPNVAWMIRGILCPLNTMTDTADVCDEPFPTPYFIGGDSATFTSNTACWSALDADGDGNGWVFSNTSFYSLSWLNTALTPDNWLFSPAFLLHEDLPCILQWTIALNPRYPHEHYGVYLSHSGGDTSSYVLIGEYDCDTTDNQRQFSLPLDDYLGDTVYIAFRHFSSTDQNIIYIHGVNIVSIDHQVDVYSNNSSWGSATGSGSYAHGSNVTVSATPFDGSTFEGWSVDAGLSIMSTDNPYTFTLMDNTSLMAVFSNPNGIEEADDEDISVYVRDGHIIVEGADGEAVIVYDIAGRPLPTTHCPLPTGVYTVKVGDRPARKVVVL